MEEHVGISLINRRHLLAAAAGMSLPVPTIASAISARPQERVSVSEWQVFGANDSNETERIQRAFDEAPIGSDLVFPPGFYRINRQLNLRRRVNLVGHGAQILGDFGRNTDGDLLYVNVEDKGNLDSRNQRIEGLSLGFLSGGRNAIGIYNRPPNLANIGLLIQNNLIGVLPESSGHAIRLEGIGTHFVTIRDCQIENGLYLNCADGVTVSGCLIFGIKTAVTTDLIPGAFQTRILGNGLVARDGALKVVRGSQIYFEQNQVEQFPPYGPNQSAAGASVSIEATEYGSRHIRIIGNNFGAGANARTSIRASGDCQDLFIDHNVFNISASGHDIELVDAAVAWTRIGPSNSLRGDTEQRRGFMAGDPLAILDQGLGTFGIKKRLTAYGGLDAGWSGAREIRFWKTLAGELRFEGVLQPGDLSEGTKIATLPLGFRPLDTIIFAAPTEGELPCSSFSLDPAGALRVIRAGGGRVHLNAVTIAILPRAPYSPHDI